MSTLEHWPSSPCVSWVRVYMFEYKWGRGGKANFTFKVRKLRIRKLLSSFRYRKSVNFLGVQVRKSRGRIILWRIHKSQIAKFLQNTAQFFFIIALEVYAIFVKRKSTVFMCRPAELSRLQKYIGSTNRKSRNCNIRGRCRKSNKLFKVDTFADLQFANLFADRQPLQV
jgi:hypothetical protein